MITKISEFQFVTAILKELCRSKGCNFVDVNISFENPSEDSIFIEKQTKNVAHTMYLIISKYIDFSEKIVGKSLCNTFQEKSDFLIRVTNVLRGFVYAENSFINPLEELSLGNLYQKPLIWLIMKDIVCPVFKVKLDNIKLVFGVNPYIDIAHYYKEEDIQKESANNYPFVFVNEIENEVVQNAFLLIETLKAYDLDPISTLKDIFESDLYDKFYGLLDLSFEDDKKSLEFINIVITLIGVNLRDFLAKKSLSEAVIKTAQSTSKSETSNQWWYLGIIEALLEPIRGSDWTSHEGIDDRAQSFWNRVETIKQQRVANHKEPGINFNDLLRLKAQEMTDTFINPNVSIQALLSSKRVW